MTSRIIIIFGLPAAGKTTLAMHLSDRLENFLLLSNDEERIKIGIPVSSGKTQIVYESIIDKAIETMHNGKDVIIDSTFYCRRYRSLLFAKLRRIKPQMLLIELATPNHICRKRVERRFKHISGLGYKDIQRYDKVEQHYTQWEIKLKKSWITFITLQAMNKKWVSPNNQATSSPQVWEDVFGILLGGHDAC